MIASGIWFEGLICHVSAINLMPRERKREWHVSNFLFARISTGVEAKGVISRISSSPEASPMHVVVVVSRKARCRLLIRLRGELCTF